MFGMPGTVGQRHSSPSAGMSTPASSSSSSSSTSAVAPLLISQANPQSSVIVPSPGQAITLHSQPQIPSISAICMEQPPPLMNPSENNNGQSACAAFTSLIAASLALAQQQQRNQQQQQAQAAMPMQAMMQPQNNLFSELLMLTSRQNSSSTPQPASTMPLPFPNNGNNHLFGCPSPMLDQQQQQQNTQNLLNAVQQQKTAIDIIQKALETIAVANQQPKMSALNTPPPSLLSNGHSHQNGLSPNMFVHLQQNGVPLEQQQQVQQNGGPHLEQQLLALFTLQQQQQQQQNSMQNGLLNGHTNLSSASLPFFPTSATGLLANNNGHSSSCNPASNPSAAMFPLNGLNGVVEQPLDLSHRAALFETISSSSSSSLISAGHHHQPQQQQQQQRNNCEIRRSASSVSYYKKSSADVSDHFQRTFSGKWPRRQPSLRAHIQASGGRGSKTLNGIGGKEGGGAIIGETVVEGEAEGGGRDTPTMEQPVKKESVEQPQKMEVVMEQERPPSRPKSRLQHRLGYTLIRKIFTSEDKQVEEHFRKSLGDDKFKQIRNAQQKQQQHQHQQEQEDAMDKMDTTNSPRS